jgi:hypothetical protein
LNDGPSTWALLVGIDEYADPQITRLKGAVKDVIAAVRWLRRIGVPDQQVFLHAHPSPEAVSELDGLGMAYAQATEPAIALSISELRAATGSRLFIFLCGHGLFEPSTGRLFLTHEANEKTGMTNLGIDAYVRTFLSMDYSRQFLFMDGCQNYPYSTGVRPTIEARRPPWTGDDPNPENGLVACFAATIGELATEVDGRGLFTSHLLQCMDLNEPWEDAVEFDFETGERTFDVRKAMDYYIRGTVSSQAALKGVTQNPNWQPYFKGSEPGFSTYGLGSAGSHSLTIEVEPSAVTPAINAIKLSLRSKRWYQRLPLPGSRLQIPIHKRLPDSLHAVIDCAVDPKAPWDAIKKTQEFEVDGDKRVLLAFIPRDLVPEAFPSPPDEDVITVDVLDADGNQAYEITDEDYKSVSREMGISSYSGGRRAIADGVEIESHESGPNFYVRRQNIAIGQDLAYQWAEGLGRSLADRDATLGIQTTIRGDEPLAVPENVEFRFPPGGPRAIAGFLWQAPSVVVEDPSTLPTTPAWRSPNASSLASLASDPRGSLEPGPWRVRLDLPWGSWTSIVYAPTTGVARVNLPRRIGLPPLRNRVDRAEITPGSRRIVGIGGRARVGVIQTGLFAERVEALKPARRRSARWALSVNRVVGVSATRIVTLGTRKQVRFPMPEGIPIAVDLSAENPKVEPLSSVKTPFWDVLVSSGRLEAVTPQEVNSLVLEKWTDPVLGLVGAYALFAARRWRYLEIVTGNLAGLMGSIDVTLLSLLAKTKGRGPSTQMVSDVHALYRAAELGDVPYFRWGVRLAIDVLSSAPVEGPWNRWRNELARIEHGLSPFSIWTVWRE